MPFYYVYILKSVKYPDKYYTGFTENLKSRLSCHNHGKCKHTLKYMPWEIKTAVAFADREKAIEFEQYLKTRSGRMFAKKRL
jgi:predicted GIY-YIG superfamily endonuclease